MDTHVWAPGTRTTFAFIHRNDAPLPSRFTVSGLEQRAPSRAWGHSVPLWSCPRSGSQARVQVNLQVTENQPLRPPPLPP